jgi:hypothetical protein
VLFLAIISLAMTIAPILVAQLNITPDSQI